MEIGYSKIDITPQDSVFQAGFSRSEKSIGVLDPIEINTVMMRSEEKIVAIVMLDSIIIEDSVIQNVKKNIHKKLGTHPENITIGCIHTHSAPAYFKPFFEDVVVETALRDQLVEQMGASLEAAYHDLEECSVAVAVDEIDGVYGNRNLKSGLANKKFITIRVYNQTGALKVIVGNMACHPTILDRSNLQLSADLFGALRRDLGQKYGCPIMMTNSYAGDTSTRFYRQKSGVEELNRVSQAIIDQLQAKTINVKGSIEGVTSVQRAFVLDTRHDDSHLKMHQHVTKMLTNAQTEQEKGLGHMLQGVLAKKDANSPMSLELRSNIYKIGEGFIISLPGDITHALGDRIEKRLAPHPVMIIGYSENYSNYFVSEAEYGLYFESFISRLAKGNADAFVEDVIKGAHSLLD